MRKSNNYYKFMEYVSYGKRCDNTICKDNGVLECTSYCTVSDIEYYENTTLGVENDWLTIKNVLVNEEVIYVYYVKGESTFYIATFILDNFKTQKELKYAIHKSVDKFFINNVDIIKETSEIEDLDENEEITSETLPHVDVDCSNFKKAPKNSIYGMFGESQDTEHDRIKYLMDTHSLSPRVTTNDDCMKTVLNMEELLTQRFGNRIAHKCKMYNNGYYGCPADRQGNRCCGKKWCAETWKRYEAIINPEWHHVSLATLANLDFDMLDEKRQLYLKLYRELKELIQDLHKCKSGRAYERRLAKMYIRNAELFDENKISHDYINYVTRKISMCNVECGLWTSRVEEATGLHKSRRYNMHTLRY